MLRLFMLFLFLSFLKTNLCFTQDFRFRHLSQTEGLASNTTFSIFQDSVGFIWIGTSEGLNRYDSKRLKKYEVYREEIKDYINPVVYDIIQDSDQELYFGSRLGLLRYNRDKDRIESMPLILNGKDSLQLPIYSIVDYSEKYLFLATLGNGLYRYEKKTGQVRKYSTQESGLNSDYVTKLLLDGKQKLWLLSGGSVLQSYNPNNENFDQIEIKDPLNGRKLNGAFSMELDSYGRIWIGGIGSALFCFNPEDQKISSHLFTNNKPVISKRIHTITETDPGVLLLGTDEGLYQMFIKSNSYQKHEHQNHRSFSLSDNFVYPVLKDRSGGIWVGTYWGGLNYSPGNVNKIQLFSRDNYPDLKIGRVISNFAEDPDGNIYISSDDSGLYFYDRIKKNVRPVLLDAQNTTLNIHSLLIDEGKLYVGTYGAGLYIYELKSGKISHFRLGDNPASNSTYSIFKDHAGKIWLGKKDAAVLFNEETGEQKEIIHLGYNCDIMDIVEDSNGMIWFASLGKGLIRYDQVKHKVTMMSEKFKGWPKECRSMLLQNNMLYVGTSGYGLWSMNIATEAFTSVKNGVIGDVRTVYQILGGNDDLWLTTDHGLIRYNRINGRTNKLNIEDGLQGNHFNPNAGLKTSNGEIFIGGANGFNIFNPSNLDQDKKQIPISLEVLLNGSSNNISSNQDRIEIPSNFKQLSISYIALYFQAPSRISYRYKLEGFDDDWFYTNAQVNQAQYTNIPPGHYHFIVMASDDGEWHNQNMVRKEIVVLPFWYQTKLFFALALFLILLLSILGYRYYFRRAILKQKLQHELKSYELESKLHEEKIQFFTHVAHEIRTPTMLIKAPIYDILKSESLPVSVRSNLKLVQRNADRLHTLINQILDISKFGHLSKLEKHTAEVNEIMVPIVDKLHLFAKQYGKTLSYDAFHKHFPLHTNRDAFEKIVSNLITNAVKFSKKKINIRWLEDSSKGITLEIADDGPGIDTAVKELIFQPFYQTEHPFRKDGFGIGLTLVKQLVDQLDMTIQLVSSKSSGACFHLRFPTQSDLETTLGHQLAEQEDVVIDNAEVEQENQSRKEQKIQVLLVDDNLDLLSYFNSQSTVDIQIYTTSNGRDALSMLEKQYIDVIISDVSMPIMDGYELCRLIKQDESLKQIPIILLSAITDQHAKLRGLECGADVYLEKPIIMDYLIAQVHSIINSRNLMIQKMNNSSIQDLEEAYSNESEQKFIRDIRNYVEENIIRADISIAELSNQLSVSRTVFYNKVKLLTGRSPNDFVRTIRLKKAAEYLKNPEFRINEICYLVGFNNASYFARCFSNEYNCLPKEFRQKTNM